MVFVEHSYRFFFSDSQQNNAKTKGYITCNWKRIAQIASRITGVPFGSFTSVTPNNFSEYSTRPLIKISK